MVILVAIEVDLPLIHGKVPLTLNQRLHWREKARRNALVRDVVHARVQQLRLPQCGHISVQLHFATGDNRRRDQDNLVATLKPCLDGITRSGLIRDDTPEHVTWYSPQIHNGPGVRRLWLEITITKEMAA